MSKVIAERDGVGDDALILAVWMQQWPRLRRSFRFCTQVVDDRSTGAEAFDLQLIDGMRAGHWSRMPNAVFASDVGKGDRIDLLLRDLHDPCDSALRSFLREVGGDISSGRAAMFSLVRLFEAVGPNAYPVGIADVISELEALGPNQARMGRAAVARLVFLRPNVIYQNLFSFALNQIRLATDLLNIDPAWLVERCSDGGLRCWDPRCQVTIRCGPLPKRCSRPSVSTIWQQRSQSILRSFPPSCQHGLTCSGASSSGECARSTSPGWTLLPT